LALRKIGDAYASSKSDPRKIIGKWYWVIDLVRWRGNKMIMQAINKGNARPGIGCNTTRKEASQTLEVDCLIDIISGRSAPNLIRHSKKKYKSRFF
jgi:hypothetical protein